MTALGESDASTRARRRQCLDQRSSAGVTRPGKRTDRADALAASGRRQVDDAREQLAIFPVRAVEVRVAIRGEGLVDRGPVLGEQEALRRGKDDAFLSTHVVPQEGCVADHVLLERERGLHPSGTFSGCQGLDLPLERGDELVIAPVLALEFVELGIASGGALAQAGKQLLFLLGMVQLDRKLAHVADDRPHQRHVGIGAAPACRGEGMPPGVHHRGQRTVLVADDADGACRQGRFADRRDQHRQAGVHQHFQHFRHECHAQPTVTAVRGQEDQVAAARPRRSDDGLRRLVADDMARFARHAEGARSGFGLGQQLLRLAERGVLVLVARDQAQHLGLAAQRAGSVGNGVKERDARADRACEGDRVADDADREVGVVDGDEEMAIHGKP